MAKTAHALIGLFLILHLLIFTTVATRDLPKTNINQTMVVRILSLGYLIPGLGRGIEPKSMNGFNPFTYNPVTGRNTGIAGFTVPDFGGSDTGRYLSGGDDTLIPNPEFEIPNPGHIGTTPVFARP